MVQKRNLRKKSVSASSKKKVDPTVSTSSTNKTTTICIDKNNFDKDKRKTAHELNNILRKTLSPDSVSLQVGVVEEHPPSLDWWMSSFVGSNIDPKLLVLPRQARFPHRISIFTIRNL
eukprot:GHVR01023563.1.p1 GENE.GHVR01023563.1~~GHVR01023563.1.p1  ORF type:complete len:118 (+),score=26.35 GHVR01023563.1:92-445(+)